MPENFSRQFNLAAEGNRDLGAKLDRLLEKLPAKIAAMPLTDPGKDIIMVQVPADGLTPSTETYELLMGFEKRLGADFTQVDCHTGISSSVWGNIVSFTFVLGRDNAAAAQVNAGHAPKDYNEFFQNLEKFGGGDALAERLSERSSLEMIHHMIHRVRAEGGDPNAIGKITYEGISFGPALRPEAYDGRYVFWNPDESWPKPALLPQFRKEFNP